MCATIDLPTAHLLAIHPDVQGLAHHEPFLRESAAAARRDAGSGTDVGVEVASPSRNSSEAPNTDSSLSNWATLTRPGLRSISAMRA